MMFSTAAMTDTVEEQFRCSCQIADWVAPECVSRGQCKERVTPAAPWSPSHDRVRNPDSASRDRPLTASQIRSGYMVEGMD